MRQEEGRSSEEEGNRASSVLARFCFHGALVQAFSAPTLCLRSLRVISRALKMSACLVRFLKMKKTIAYRPDAIWP